jgi:hypothetical protein
MTLVTYRTQFVKTFTASQEISLLVGRLPGV